MPWVGTKVFETNASGKKKMNAIALRPPPT